MRRPARAARTRQLLTPEQYNQLFTMHGVTMIFLYALPVLSGFSNYLLAAAARLARHGVSAAQRLLLLGLPVLRASSSTPSFADRRRRPTPAGSTTCPTRSRAVQSRARTSISTRSAMIFLGISTTVGSINFIVTLLRTRAPGMSINRVPILSLGHADRLGRQPSRRAGGQPRLLPAVAGPPVRHAFLRRRRRRPAAALAAPVLDVRPSVGLRHRAAGDGHGLRRRCRSSAAGRWSATPPSRSRRCRR